MASRITGIELAWVVEQSDPSGHGTAIGWPFQRSSILGLAPGNYLRREWVVSAPNPSCRSVREAWAASARMDATTRKLQRTLPTPPSSRRRVPTRTRRPDRLSPPRGVSTSARRRKRSFASRPRGHLHHPRPDLRHCGPDKVRKTARRPHVATAHSPTRTSRTASPTPGCSDPIGHAHLDL